MMKLTDMQKTNIFRVTVFTIMFMVTLTSVFIVDLIFVPLENYLGGSGGTGIIERTVFIIVLFTHLKSWVWTRVWIGHAAIAPADEGGV